MSILNILSDLEKRKIINNVTNYKKIKKLTSKDKIYIGFDPSAESLHLGNYIQIIILQKFQKKNFNCYALVGGATGYIGDPSGKQKERILLSNKILKKNKKKIKKQLKKFNFKILDNYQWFKNFKLLKFLKKIGKLISINYMLNKEVISSRLKTGISFTEFTYQLIQGWDFKILYEKYNIKLQIGGSDQWGNITTGIELIRKTIGENNLASGITTNLLTTYDGKKFGKSENNVLWIDKNMTSPYEMYQYLFSTSDQDIEKYLKWLTFYSIKEIEEIIKKHNKNKSLRYAQKKLSFKVIENIHSLKDAQNSLFISKIFFNNFNFNNLNKKNILLIEKFIPTFKNIEGNIIDVLIKLKIAKSKREAKEFIINNAIKVNNQKINDLNFKITSKLNNLKINIIQKGPKKIFLVKY